MAAEQIHFVTGRLAEKSLRETVERLSRELDFTATVQVMPITVAALMTPQWIARRLEIPAGTTRVIVPGYCDDLSPLQQAFDVEFQTGPKDLKRLSEFLGGKTQQPVGYGEHDIQIIAEINHAPRLSIAELLETATRLVADGADLVDFGCIPGYTCNTIGDSIRALTEAGIRVSVDSFNPEEILPAARAGAELVLSVNSTNRKYAPDWGIEVVVIPDEFETLQGLDETLDYLTGHSVPFRIDPIVEPLGCGFANSLGRYLEVRRRYPDAEIMMGIGNLTELTDCDSAGINVLLLGFCQEVGIRSVLTTQVINWARSSVKECDLARRLVHYAVQNRVPAKHLDESLVMLRDAKVVRESQQALEDLARQIKDQNFRIFADGDEIHVLGGRQHFQDPDPFHLFDQMLDAGFTNLDASHSFYLGFEMCKAMIANQLAKEYHQDQALHWGYLTVEEKDRHRLQKRRKQVD